jgi:hypothetical protein
MGTGIQIIDMDSKKSKSLYQLPYYYYCVQMIILAVQIYIIGNSPTASK